MRSRNQSATPHGAVGGGSPPRPPLSIDLPKYFRLAENFLETAGAISMVRDHLPQKPRNTKIPHINFNQIAEVDHAAALMLAAEIDAWKRVNPHIALRSNDRQWNPRIAGLFADMGLFELLGVARQSSSVEPGSRDTVFFRFLTGVREEEFEEQYIRYREKIENEINAQLLHLRVPLFVSLSEAVVNAAEHSGKNSADIRWWVSASYNKSSGELSVLCYDRGLTIPKTIPSSNVRERLFIFLNEKALSDRIDCNLIEAAMRSPHGRTQTGNPGRGKGIRQLMDFIDKSERGELRVYSRKGMVSYAKRDAHKDAKFTKKQTKKSIRGTLIEWRVIVDGDGGAKNSIK